MSLITFVFRLGLSIKTDPEWAFSPKSFTCGCSAVAYGFTVSVWFVVHIRGSSLFLGFTESTLRFVGLCLLVLGCFECFEF